MNEPTHGYTKYDGKAVHRKVVDHHRADTSYQQFNKRAAIYITAHVGTMTCAWVFCAIALCSLPATLYAAGVIGKLGLITELGFILVITWLAQSFIQLVLLPALMVGQNLQNDAADVRSSKTFEDVEHVKKDVLLALDRLDTGTTGGIKDVLDAIEALRVATLATPPKKSRKPSQD